MSIKKHCKRKPFLQRKRKTYLKFGRSISWSVTVRARIARLAFLGKDSEICPSYKLVGLKNFVWYFGSFRHFLPWHRFLEISKGKYYEITIPFFWQHIRNFFLINVAVARRPRSGVSMIWGMLVSKWSFCVIPRSACTVYCVEHQAGRKLKDRSASPRYRCNNDVEEAKRLLWFWS